MMDLRADHTFEDGSEISVTGADWDDIVVIEVPPEEGRNYRKDITLTAAQFDAMCAQFYRMRHAIEVAQDAMGDD